MISYVHLGFVVFLLYKMIALESMNQSCLFLIFTL